MLIFFLAIRFGKASFALRICYRFQRSHTLGEKSHIGLWVLKKPQGDALTLVPPPQAKKASVGLNRWGFRIHQPSRFALLAWGGGTKRALCGRLFLFGVFTLNGKLKTTPRENGPHPQPLLQQYGRGARSSSPLPQY